MLQKQIGKNVKQKEFYLFFDDLFKYLALFRGYLQKIGTLC